MVFSTALISAYSGKEAYFISTVAEVSGRPPPTLLYSRKRVGVSGTTNVGFDSGSRNLALDVL